ALCKGAARTRSQSSLPVTACRQRSDEKSNCADYAGCSAHAALDGLPSCRTSHCEMASQCPGRQGVDEHFVTSTVLRERGIPMAGKRALWRMVFVLTLGLLAPTSAMAGPFFGEW